MAHILVTSTNPPNKSEELLKAYSGKKPDYPDFIKKVNEWAVVDQEHKTYAVYEVEKEKLYDGLMAIGKRYAIYAQVEGYKYKIEPLIDLEEAIANILQK